MPHMKIGTANTGPLYLDQYLDIGSLWLVCFVRLELAHTVNSHDPHDINFTATNRRLLQCGREYRRQPVWTLR